MAYDNRRRGGEVTKPVTTFSSNNKCSKFVIWPNKLRQDDFTASLSLRYYNKEQQEFVDKKSLFPDEWADVALIILAAIKWRCDYLGLDLPVSIAEFMKRGFSMLADEDSTPEMTIAKKMNEGIDKANKPEKKKVEDINFDDDDIPF